IKEGKAHGQGSRRDAVELLQDTGKGGLTDAFFTKRVSCYGSIQLETRFLRPRHSQPLTDPNFSLNPAQYACVRRTALPPCPPLPLPLCSLPLSSLRSGGISGPSPSRSPSPRPSRRAPHHSRLGAGGHNDSHDGGRPPRRPGLQATTGRWPPVASTMPCSSSLLPQGHRPLRPPTWTTRQIWPSPSSASIQIWPAVTREEGGSSPIRPPFWSSMALLLYPADALALLDLECSAPAPRRRFRPCRSGRRLHQQEYSGLLVLFSASFYSISICSRISMKPELLLFIASSRSNEALLDFRYAARNLVQCMEEAADAF
ncbi:hypothetical protein EJB05_34809, partial [Eragrostis curvula]